MIAMGGRSPSARRVFPGVGKKEVKISKLWKIPAVKVEAG
jgi:hypothetical protein